MTAIPLIVAADDFGLTDATCDAVLDAADRGVVTATSVLALAPAARTRTAELADGPLAVGVHLALVGEDPPLLSAREIPTLVDERGRLASSWRSLVPRLAAGRVDRADVRRELGAQIDAVAAHLHPDHLDAHQHLQLWSTVADAVIDLAVERGIARVRVPRPSRSSVRNLAVSRMADRLARRVDAADLTRTDRFRGLDEAGRWSTASLVAALEELAGGHGSVEINLHPGAPTDPDRGRYRWGYRWGQELDAACAQEVVHAVERLGSELVGR